MSFAKLFETEELGQIVVIQQINDEDKPEVRIWFDASPLAGICNTAFSYKNNEEGWKRCDRLFNDYLTKEKCCDLVKEARNSMQGMLAES